MNGRKLAILATLGLAAACTGKNGTTSSSGSGSSGGSTGSAACTVDNAATCTCRNDNDCPQSYTCDVDVTKTCIFQCTVRDDCTGSQAPADVKSTCTASQLGCECEIDPVSNLSQCVTKICATDSDCGSGKVCADGKCAAAPTAADVDACKVFPEYQLMHVGQPFTFTAQAYKAGQAVRVPDSLFTWSAADASITAGSGSTFTGAAASSAAVDGPKATIGSVSCTAKVRVIGAPAANSMQVTVIDALSGQPIDGVTVQLEGAAATQPTVGGTATFTSVSAGAHTVSAFHTDYGYVTYANTTSTDLLIPLLRHATTKEGGVKGTMANLFDTGTSDVHVGIVGMSIAGGITDISFDLLLGPTEKTDITLGSTTYHDIPLPSGVMIGLSSSKFKDHYKALGRSGYCPGKETQSANGECGNRSIWALAGDVPIAKLPIDQLSGGGLSGSNLNIGPILTQLLPVFRNFHSTLVRDQEFSLGPTDPTTGAVSEANLTPHDLDNGTPPAVKLAIKQNIKVPSLPSIGSGKYMDGIVVLAGADVPGRGLVPLGLTAGVDEDPNSHATDGHVVDENGRQDYLIAHMAPTHGGAEGSPYKLGVVAASFKGITGGLSGTAIIATPSACDSSAKGICYNGTVDVSGQTWLGLPTGASFDYASRRFTPPSVSGADLIRALFETGAQHRWVVWAKGDVAFNLPTPPAGFEDRSRNDGTANGPRSDFVLLAASVGTDFDNLVAFSDKNVDHFDSFLTKFSIKDYPPPAITINTPAAGASVPAGSAVNVTIKNDDANNNTWYVCWSADANPIVSTANCTAGGPGVDSSGKSNGTLPGNATGSGYVHAVLVDGSGAVLNPAVEAAAQITVQ